MKRIGILTFHNTTNYGAVLQAFALQKKILELGAESEIINYHCKNIEKRELFVLPSMDKNLINNLRKLKNYVVRHRKRKVIKNFLKKNIIISKKEFNKETIKSSNDIYDAIVVGSDMIWELKNTGGDLTYFLDFASKNKRYSYAASIGNNYFEKQYEKVCIKNLEQFQLLSVREIQTKQYLTDIMKKEVMLCCDPTLLYNATFWRGYEEKPLHKIYRKYIVLYFCDENGIMLKNAKEIADKNNYDIYILGESSKKIDGCKIIANASVGEFLYYIDNAELVITGSYHGMIFSINFNTNFMYFNRVNSNRMESIAQITHFEGRKLMNDIVPCLKCDFSIANKEIEKLRKDSEKYLKTVINK